jgi:hypothetical protein
MTTDWETDIVERWHVAHHRRYNYWACVRINRNGGSHSISGPTREQAETHLARFVANGVCVECGDALNADYMEERKRKILDTHTCFECLFWLEYVASQSDPTHAIVSGNHYVIKRDGDHWAGFIGHGGAEFDIRFNDGREVVSHNLWAQGSVPERFRGRLPNNAVFVSRGHKSIGPFAGYGGAGSADVDCVLGEV